MSDSSSTTPDHVAAIQEQFEAAGWPKAGILRESFLSIDGARRRPRLFLTYSAYPFATVDVVRSDLQVPTLEHGTPAEGSPTLLALESNGTVTVRRGSPQGPCWSPVPSPKDLWELLGRQWDEADPRLYNPNINRARPAHHVLAVGLTLDAILAGRRRLQLAMPQGSGKTMIMLEIAWKLLETRRAKRVLYLTHRRDEANHAGFVFSDFGRYYEVATLQQTDPPTHSSLDIATVAYFLTPSRARLDGLPSDFYDLILIPELRDLQGWRRVVEHFPTSCVIGFSSPETPLADADFGPPVFLFTIEEALSVEESPVPEGFRRVRLGDVAEISAGVSSSAERPTTDPPLLRAGDLATDGTWTTPAIEFISNASKEPADARYGVRPGDILVAGVQNPLQPRISVVPSSAPLNLQIHSSLYRVRLLDPTLKPDDIASFLRSDAGRRAMSRFGSSLAGSFRLTVRGLLETPVLIPIGNPSPFHSSPAPELPATPPMASLSAAGQALKQLRDVVVPDLDTLERDPQARDPNLIAARLREIAATLARPHLSERIMSNYPLPIALAYRRFHDSRFNVYEQVQRLRDLFEAASFFTYNVVLADALRRLDPRDYFVADGRVRTAYDGYSMAHRISFVETIAEMARNRSPRELFMPKLCESRFAHHARQLQSDFRNHISHSATASESRQRALLNQYRPVVETLLEELSFLEDYRLARIASIHMRRGRHIRRVELYQGVAPALDEQDFAPEDQPTLAEHEHLVLIDENDEYLDLFPMYQFVANDQTGHDTHICFLKQRRSNALHGESVQGSADITLDGSAEFNTLRARMRDTP